MSIADEINESLNVKGAGVGLDEYAALRERKAIGRESNFRQFMGQATLGIYPILASAWTPDEKKKALLDYKIRHPGESMLWSGLGAAAGTIGTLGIGKALQLGAETASGAITASEVATIAGETPLQKALSGYELLQGGVGAKTITEAGKNAAIAFTTQSVVDSVDTASLDPQFLMDHFGEYAGNIALSAGVGFGVGASLKGLQAGYLKFVKGQSLAVSIIALTDNQIKRGHLGDELMGIYPEEYPNKDINAAIANQQRGGMIEQNRQWPNTLGMRNVSNAEKIGRSNPKNLSDTLKLIGEEDVYHLKFASDLNKVPELAESIGRGEINAQSFFEDWKEMLNIQSETKSFGKGIPQKMKDRVSLSTEETGLYLQDTMVKMRQRTEELLRKSADVAFQ